MSFFQTQPRHWLKNVTVFNIAFIFLIATGYWQWINFSQQPALEKSYIIATQVGWLGLIPAIMSLSLFFIRFVASKTAVFISILLFSAMTAYFFADLLVFAQYKFHINAIIIDLFLADGVINFPLMTWIKFSGFVAVLLTVQITVHYFSINYGKNLSFFSKSFLFIWFMCLAYSQALHAWKDASYDVSITGLTRYFPFYRPLTAKSFFYNNGLVNQDVSRQNNRIAKSENNQLIYPKTPITFTQPQKPMNVLFILIDAWRYDDFSNKYTPNMYEFAKSGVKFEKHLSGGNSTEAGVFSLFYGLPSPYWVSFRNSGIRPALMETAQKQGYQFKILSSAQLNRPPLDRTVFNQIDDLRVYTPGDTSSQRDKVITDDMLTFLEHRDPSTPFFGFLFYDSVHSAEIPQDEELVFQPSWTTPRYLKLDNEIDPEPFHNLYRNALYYTDKKINQVLTKLKEKNLDENTVVIITSDHGEEFNDLGKNYWGHGSNYAKAQIHVPMIIHAPNLTGRNFTYKTSHFDVTSTLMENYMGVTTSASAYSLGSNMFNKSASDKPLIVGSYNDYAIVSKQKIHVISPTGIIEPYDADMNKLPDATFPAHQLKQVMSDLTQFYK